MKLKNYSKLFTVSANQHCIFKRFYYSYSVRVTVKEVFNLWLEK